LYSRGKQDIKRREDGAMRVKRSEQRKGQTRSNLGKRRSSTTTCCQDVRTQT